MNSMRSAVAIAVFAASAAFAADSKLLALMPSDAKVVGGINVTSTSASPFGQFMLSRMKSGDPAFSKFVAATGFDPRTHLQEVVFAGSLIAGQRGNGVVAARGTFNGPQIIAAAKTAGGTSFQYNGIEVLRGKRNEGAVAFLDGTTAVAGDEEMVKRVLDQRAGGVTLDPKIAAKITDVSSRFDAWMVSTAPVGTFSRLAPNQQTNAAMNSAAMQSIEQTSGGVRFGTIVEVSGEAVTKTDKDALALADVIRFMTGLMQIHRDKNPEIGKFGSLLDSLQVRTTASTVQVSLSIPQADLEQFMTDKKAVRRAAVDRERN